MATFTESFHVPFWIHDYFLRSFKVFLLLMNWVWNRQLSNGYIAKKSVFIEKKNKFFSGVDLNVQKLFCFPLYDTNSRGVTSVNPLSANPTKWSNTLKQFVGKLSVFDHFVGLALKESRITYDTI